MSEDALRANGTAVRNLRKKRFWTQEDLATKVGCAKRTIENVESEKPIADRTLLELAQALGVSPGELRLPDTDAPVDDKKDTVQVSIQCPQDGPRNPERDGNVAVSTGTATIDIVINKDFHSFTAEEQNRLPSIIKRALE